MWTCIKLHDIFTQMIDATLNNRNEKKNTLNWESYRIDPHGAEYARSGTSMGSHWTSPADP